jgi:hypothetical protein
MAVGSDGANGHQEVVRDFVQQGFCFFAARWKLQCWLDALA